MKKNYIYILLFLALAIIANPAHAQDPFIPKYDAVKRSERCFTVTNDINNQFGSVWWSEKVDFSQDTLFNFVVYMGDKDGPGADGLAFVMHQDPRDTTTDTSQTVIISGSNTFDLEAATGDDGGGLGFAYKLGNYNNNTIPGAFPEKNIENHKIKPSVAIEIDTWRNNEVHDGVAGLDANGVNQPLSPYVGWDHTSVIYNGDLYGGQQQITDANGYTDRILPLKPSYAFGTSSNGDGSVYHNIEDDGCYTFQVKWIVNGDGTQTLQLWADIYDGTSSTSNLQMIMTHTDDMLNNVFGGDPMMRFGFTGSTGGARNEQTICLLGENLKPFAQNDYASIPMNTTVDIRIEDNDNDPDGDQLHVPVIIDPPDNGQALIIYNASTDQNELEYTPDNNYTGPDSLTYVTCDVNSTKCYAKCDTAIVYINVGCTSFDATVAQISPNNVCSDSAVANGAATADVDGSSLFGILWYESFEDLSNGTTVDNGTSAWSFTTSGGCDKDIVAEVATHSGPQKFMVQESDCEVIWSTEVIDISAVTDVAVSIDLQENGGLENSDYISVYYVLDGGAEVLLDNGYHQNDFSGTEVALASGLNGSTLQIVVRAKNNSGSERYYWDNISITAVGAGVPDVTYNWYEGTTPTGPIVYSGITYSGIPHGDYTVVAVDNTSGCPSNPATVTIDSTGTNVQGGYVKQLAAYTNCALPYNGALGAGVFNGTDSTTIGYLFEWYFQEDPKIPAFLKSTGAVYSGLESREFSVVITDNTTGCDTTINREVLNEAVLPSVTASTDADVVSCLDPETGTVSAFVMAPVIVPIWDEDFSDMPTGTIEDTGATAWTWETPDDSSKVEYVGIATGNDDPEADNHLEFHETRGNHVNWWTEVIDISGYTDVSISFDLYASIKMNERLAEPPDPTRPRYIYVYYSIDGGPKTLFSNGAHDEIEIPSPITLSLSGINASTVQIFIEMSNGGGGERYFIDDILIEGGLPPAPTTTGYTFYWYDGPAVTASADYTGPLYDGVASGQYTVVAVNDATSCESESRTVTVNDLTVIPDILITVDSDQWSCDPATPTGELTGAVDEGGTPTTTGYTFNWYRGPNDVVPARPGYTGGPNVDGLEADTYRLVVAADTTGCSNFADTVIQDVTVIPPDLTLTPTHVTSCAAGNGAISVGVVGDPNDYSYELYSGFGAVPANLITTINSPLFTNLNFGDYTVVAFDKITKCETNPATVTLNDATVLPTATFNKTPQTSCDPASPTGTLTAVPGSGAVSDYTYDWTDGLGNPIVGPGDGETISSLAAGNYTLRITNDATQCFTDYNPTVDDGIVLPVATATADSSTYCGTAVNGQLHGLGDGVAVGYTFNWYNTDYSVQYADASDLTGIAPGDYHLAVMNNTTSCVSDTVNVTVDARPVVPQATIASLDQYSCDPANLRGGLTANVIADPITGSTTPADFTFAWTDALSNPIAGTGINGEVLTGLDAGNYQLVLTDNTSECTNTYLPSVANGIVLPVATASADSSTYCGTAVNGQLHGLGDGITAGFTFNWYNTDYSVQLADASDLAGIAPGDYHLAVMNDTSWCVSDTVNVTVDAQPVLPQANIVSQDQYSCDPVNPMGALTANVVADPITGSSTPADFTFAWTDALSNPIAGSGINGEVITGLDAGNYQLVLTDNTSECNNTYLPSVNNGIILPVASATADSSTYCGTAVNGQLHGLGDGITAGFTFNWYNTDYSVQLADASDLTGIAPGDYHLAVMNDTTWCVSDTVHLTVDARPVLPQANIVSQDQYSCDPANLMGELTANVVADPITGSSTPADFTFAWTDALSNPIAGSGINGEVVTGLDAGNYQLVLTDNTSECNNTYLPSVSNGIILPVATASADSSTYCGIAVNGQLHGLGDGIAAGFTFNWYNTDYSVQLADASDLAGIAPGDYHLAVMNDTTWCVSDTVNVTVDARPVIPLANIVSQDQLSCDPGNLMGRLTANVVADPITGSTTAADFSFAWTDGLGNPIVGSGMNGEVLAGLDVGNYQLVLTDNTSECSNTYLPSVANGIVLPVVTAATTATTMCAANVNGQIDAAVSGVAAPYSGYTFDWERVSDGFTWSSSTFNASALASGDYLITATLDSTSCTSNQITASVANNSITPNPVFSVTHNSSCDPANPNGEIVVTNVSNEADPFPAGYDFLWYDGNSAGPQLVAPTVSFPNDPDSSLLANKAEGSVALVITNSTTLCSNDVPMTVNKINIFPQIDTLIVTDAPNCAEPYFSAAVIPSVTDPVSSLHTYNWYQATGAQIPGVTTNVIEDSIVDAYALPAGDYKVVVVNEWSCPSDTSFFEIKDVSAPPTFTLTAFNNISCDPNDSTGILVAAPGAGSTISQYEWFYNLPLPGNEVLPAIPAGDSVHYDLGGAFYAVRATDAITSCSSVEFATILDLPANKPLLDTTYIVDITSCVSPNGEFGLQVSPMQKIPPALTQNRTYTFYTENNTTLADTTAVGVRKLTTDPAIAAADTVAFLSIPSGNWTSLVVDNYTHCVSDPLTINMPEAPGVVLTVLDSLLPTDCHPDSTGWYQYGASSPLNIAPAGDGFSFTWDYWGTQFAGPVESNIGTIDPTGTDSFKEKRDGLKSGYYTLFVLDSFSMCTAVDTIYIPVKDAPPSVLSDAINATDCVPGDGVIEFEVVNQPTSGLIGDYDVILFSGTTTDPAKEMQRVNVAAYNTPYTFGPAGADFIEDLPPGNYTLVTQENSGLSNGCFSEPLSVTLTLDITPPTITASITDDYSCNATGTGELIVTATDNAEGDLNNIFDYEWYAGTDTVGAVLSPIDMLSNRLAGNYTVKVTDTDRQGNGCRYKRTFDLPKVLKTITLTTSKTDNTNCAPDQNGSAQITDVDEDGAGGGFMASYTDFTLSDSGFNPITIVAAGPANFTNLAPGNYYLSAENIATGCVSQVKSVKIADNSVDPVINLVVNSLDYGCTAATANGDLEVDINGSQNLAEYSFTWYKGAIAPGNDFDYDANATGLTANTSSQIYSIEVVDIDGTDGSLSCRSTLAYTLVHQPTQIYFLAADLLSTDQTICGPNGSIAVDTIRMNDGSGEVASGPSFAGVFDARLLDSGLNLIDPIANPYASFDPVTGLFGTSNVPAGTYYVEAAITATGCSYGGATQVIIDSLARRPVVTMIEEMPDYACAGGIPTGRLAPTVAGGSDGTFNYGDFTYTWSANVASTDNGGGTYADKAIALSPDTYILTVRDIAGADATCETTINFTLSQKRHKLAINASAVNQTICGPNGSIQLDAINEDGNNMALNAAEWTVTLLDNAKADITPVGPTGFAGDPFTSLSAANYFVRVQDDSTLCYSDPLPIVVTDVSKDPVVTIAQEMPDYACAGGIPTGILAPTVTGGSDGTFNYGDFIYSWSANVVTTDNGGGTYVDKATSLSPDSYTLTVTDNAGVDAGCITVVDFTLNQAQHDLTILASVTNQTICGPNGTIQLDAIDEDGNNMPLNAAEWTVFLLDNAKADITPVGPTGFAGDPFTSLGAANYFVRVQDDSTLCYSDPLPIVVTDVSKDPVVVIAQEMPDYACVGGIPTGILAPTVTGGSDGTFNYGDFIYSWSANVASTDNGGGAYADKAVGLSPNLYTLFVTDNAGADAGCVTKVNFTLNQARHDLLLTASATDQTICGPNGAIQLDGIDEDGNSMALNASEWTVFLLDNTQADLTPVGPTGFAGDPFTALGAAKYFVRVQDDSTLCYSDPLGVTVTDVSKDPVVTITQEMPDYACAGGIPTGILAPNVAGGTDGTFNYGDFTYSWSANVLTTNNGGGAYADKGTGLSPDTYTLTVTDNAGVDANCVTTVNFTLNQARHDLTIAASPTDQTICGPNGTIQLDAIDEDGNNMVLNAAEWTVFLLDNTQTDITPAGPTGFAGDPFLALSAANYFIRVQDDSTLCYSDPLAVAITDRSKDPIVTIVQEMPDYACAGGIPTGILAPAVAGGSDGTFNYGDFTYNWSANVVTTDNGGGAYVDKATGLSPDLYTLTVTDNAGVDAGCVTTLKFTLNQARHNLSILASGTDQTICGPNGTIQLDAIDEDGNSMALNAAEWTVFLLDNTKTDITPAGPTGFAGDPFTGIGTADYFVRVRDDSTLCFSDMHPVKIIDVSEDPVLNVAVRTPQYSLNPNPASWTGVLEVNAVELGTGTPDPLGYTYSWHAGLDNTTPVLSTLDSVTQLEIGDYTVYARSVTSNCEASFSAYLPYQYLEPVFATLVAPQTLCAPGNGAIDITNITLEGDPDLLSDYTFNWHHDVYNASDIPDNVTPGNDTRTAYVDLNSGTYYVIARENWWMVESLPVQVQVADSSTNPIIVFDGTNYQAVTSCDQVTVANGALAVDVYEDLANPYLPPPPYSYSYRWFNGDAINPANEIAGETSNTIAGLRSGKYSVEVTNTANNCISQETYNIEDQSVIPNVYTTQTPNINCQVSIANGIASATVINSSANYEFHWYEGTDTSGAPDYIGMSWDDRPAGEYSVIAIDEEFGNCISEPVIMKVIDNFTYPVILVNELSPVTNCDPERPNGVLTAVTQDGIDGYTFEWYLNDSLYNTGPTPNNLGLYEYQLVARNDVTQCETTMQAGPTALFRAVPAPDVEILDEQTSCVNPNAIVTASVNGSVTNHILRYYNKFTQQELTNYYEHYTLYNLDTSTYYVTAEDRTTGCISDSTEFVISDETYFPEFEIIANPSNCEDPTGSADVVISDMTRDFKVTWYNDEGFMEQQKEIVYIPIGTYYVDVEGTDGCVTSSQVEIKGDVIVYNGVSPNDDGMNDYFKIVCLQFFPDNNVKIYNRAGALVYEQSNYDHFTERRFEGISNRGLNLIGQELPIGTYFYVIDKNDGSKAKVGYLELKR